MDPAITNELSKLDDGIAFRASPDHFHHTWARTFYSAPELYIQPQSVEEVEKVTTLARRCRRRITTVGSGHSPSDLTCTSSWMVNLDKFNKILSVDRETGLVTMQAGIRLFQLSEELDKLGLAMPNLGSINEQSIAGAISTGTHGSTLLHSILSSSVTRLRITLSNSQTVTCSPEENEDLFRAALCSLGALGVITEITFLAVPAFSLHWKQTLYPHKHVLDTWNTNLWTQGEFVRVWWYPYTRRATIWHASKTTQPALDLQHRAASFDSSFGYHVYHNLLYIAQWVPRILPWVEWFITGMQFGFSAGSQTTIEAIQPSRQALLMDCLYSQTVNEWALPLRNGPTALRRLTSWLNRLQPTDPEYVEHGIPYSAEGLWVHAPIEVRVSDTTLKLENNDGSSRKSVRPHLDTSAKDGPTLYLNATLYRPYNMDPPCLARYYQAFEYLMRELDGKPHWAKNFETTNEELNEMYGDDLKSWLNVRNEADPEGMFVGPWHREHILGEEQLRFALEEAEVDRKPMRKGGVEIFGELASKTAQKERDEVGESPVALSENVYSYSSQSSFDFLNRSEAPESQQLPNSSANGTKGKGLAEAMEQVAGNREAAEDATKLATIATLNSSISSIEAVLRDLADSQTTRSEYTASSTPDSFFQEKSEQITSGSEEAPSVDEAALVEEFWIGAAAAKAEAAAEQEAARKEQAAKEQAAKEQAAKEQAAKEQAAKEQAAKEAAAKEQAAKEQATAKKEAAAKEEAARKEESAAKEAAMKESVPAKKTAAAKKTASPKKTTAAAKKTVTAKESAKDAEQTVTTQQAQQHEGTKARRLSFAKVAALSSEEAPKPTEPAAPVLDLHHLPEPSPPKTNGRHFLPLQSRANGANAKSKVANKEAASPKAAKKEQQSQTTDAAASPKQAKKEQQSTTNDAAAPHSKREAFDGSASTRAAKRAKLAELAEAFDNVEPAAAAKKENVPPPVARPNSLDDMLEEQAKAREGKPTAGGWRPQARPNSLDELLEEQARERKEKSTEGGWRPQLRVNS